MRQKASRTGMVAIMVVGLIATSGNGFSQQLLSSSLGVVPYPSKGQSATQQSQDEGECYAWAKQQTGIDLNAVTNQPPPSSSPARGQLVKGDAKGAVGGAAIGAIAGDTGKGAAIGAVAGTVAGRRQATQNKLAQARRAQQAKAEATAKSNKAFGACLEGKGYAVK